MRASCTWADAEVDVNAINGCRCSNVCLADLSSWRLMLRCQPLRDVRDHGPVDVLRRFVFRGRGGTCAGKEQVVVGVVDADRDIRSVSEARLPSGEIVLDGHLIVAATLEYEHRPVQRRGGRD